MIVFENSQGKKLGSNFKGYFCFDRHYCKIDVFLFTAKPISKWLFALYALIFIIVVLSSLHALNSVTILSDKNRTNWGVCMVLEPVWESLKKSRRAKQKPFEIWLGVTQFKIEFREWRFKNWPN